MAYILYYWPEIPGRGEFVRLALEEANIDYVDIARAPADQGGVTALTAMLEDETLSRPPFAPPFLKANNRLIAQTANILLYLGQKHGLAPSDEAGWLWTHQLQLTMADLVVEIHDTHHPISANLYYEDQKPEARRRTEDFLATRLPKYLGYFERVLAMNEEAGRLEEFLVGSQISYADLSLFHIVTGLHHAFPTVSALLLKDYPHIVALSHQVGARRRIRDYLHSSRHLGFNEMGIFRHYAELDRAP